MSTTLEIPITPSQCRMARAALRVSVRDAAEICGVVAMTITRFERENTKPYETTLTALRKAFEKKGVEFIPAGDGKGPGVRLAHETG